MKFYEKCGKEINEEAVICPHCGCQIKAIKQTTSGPDKLGTVGLVFSIINTVLGF